MKYQLRNIIHVIQVGLVTARRVLQMQKLWQHENSSSRNTTKGYTIYIELELYTKICIQNIPLQTIVQNVKIKKMLRGRLRDEIRIPTEMHQKIS